MRTVHVLIALLLGVSLLTLGGCGGSAYAYRMTGDEAMKGGRYADAVEAYNESLDLRPGEPYVRNALGRALLANKQPTLAIEQLRVACLQAPENGAYIDDLASALIAAGRNDDCYRMLRANTSERGQLDDWLRLGRFAQKMGDMDVARQALLTAARIDRGQTVAPQVALFEFYYKIGDKVEAERRLRMAYYLSPHDPDVVRGMTEMGFKPQGFSGWVPAERLAGGE